MNCTCPCLDCVEGRHCGQGGYAIGNEIVGFCSEIPWDDHRWDTWDDDEDYEDYWQPPTVDEVSDLVEGP